MAPRRLIEWDAGKQQRQFRAFHTVDARYPPEPELIAKYIETAGALDQGQWVILNLIANNDRATLDMPRRSSKSKKVSRKDTNTLAFSIVEQATGKAKKPEESEKNPAAVALGRLGGLKGGKARAQNSAQRSAPWLPKKQL